MITSKLTSKAQTTIPQAVRTALHLHAGDAIAYAIDDARVIITNARSLAPAEDPFKTFVEWDSEADHRAYDGL
jgi:antitoxin PrlF